MSRSHSGYHTELEQIYRSLRDDDLKMMTGRIKREGALDLLITGLVK